jgi:HSP20 family molecular chaperone IbpA
MLHVAGAAGSQYELSIWNPATVASVDGAQLRNGKLLVQIPSSDSDPYTHKKITIHFVGRH